MTARGMAIAIAQLLSPPPPHRSHQPHDYEPNNRAWSRGAVMRPVLLTTSRPLEGQDARRAAIAA